MKPALGRLGAAAQAFALTGALSACMLTGGDTLVVPGGAEDFPNTIAPLGRVAVHDLSSVGGWEQIPVVTPTMPELPSLESLQITPPNGKAGVLGKVSLSQATVFDTLNLDVWQVDTTRVLEAYLLGRIYAYAADVSATRMQRDTVVAQYLGDRTGLTMASLNAVRDSIRANPGRFLMPLEFRGTASYGPAGAPAQWVTHSYRLRNMNSEGTIDQAEYRTITPEADGSTRHQWVKIYGPEGEYARADAVPEEFELLHRGPAGDTLSWTLVKDADWDRRLWTPDGRGVVDLTFRVRNPPTQPGVARLHSTLRAAYRSAGNTDSLDQLKYHEQRWLHNGRNVTFSFQGAGTEEDLLVGADTARMTVDTVYALRDSLIKHEAVYKMLLGPVPERMDGHKLVGYSVRKFWRTGPLSGNRSEFLPDEPMSMGETVFTGLMSSTSVTRGGDSTTTQGRVDASGFNLVVRYVKNHVATTYDVVLNAAGDVLHYAPVAPSDATAAVRQTPARR
ncbi:MAG TPA: hypothetical protein VKZ88_06000 [Fibrobacteria bacterium]|jgi:hypothetical protein|nr:hypothetical protein [Fibrobacteria bacterium]